MRSWGSWMMRRREEVEGERGRRLEVGGRMRRRI